jgi:hypothetical protein
MTSRFRFVACLFVLALAAGPAGSFITAEDGGGTTGGGGGGGGGGTQTGGGSSDLPDGTPVFDPRHDHVHDFELRGYTCSSGNFAQVECRQCFPQNDGTQICDDTFCNNDICDGGRSRAGIPQTVNPARYTLWAVGFAPGASSYWLGDFDGDGRRDLGAQVGGTVEAAISGGTYFQDVGAYASPAPVESSGPSTTIDVNGDGVADQLSISPAHHLQVAISTTSGATSVVELTDTWCSTYDCLIADVNGDGLPDLVDVARTTANGGLQAGDVWVSLGSPVLGFPALGDPPPPTDSDGDGVIDRFDDCTTAADPDQLDSDGDGIGNACDADVNQDGVVTKADQDFVKACIGVFDDQNPQCAPADFDGDGVVGVNDYITVLAAPGLPPGPSAANHPPHIELAQPADGTIYSPAQHLAWVAGWVPSVDPGAVQVLVNGEPVAVTGDENFFSTFVELTLPAGDPALFRPIVVEAISGEARGVERRTVLVGDHVEPGGRAHDAIGAQITAHGLERIQEYLSTKIPEFTDALLAELDGTTDDYDCAEVSIFVTPICWTGYTISNARIDAPPVVTAELLDGAFHVHISLSALRFDWLLHVEGPDCGDDANITNIEADVAYQLQPGSDGHLQAVELYDPIVTGDRDIDGCWGFNGRVGNNALQKIRDRLDQTTDYSIFHYPQRGAVADLLETIFNSLNVSGRLETTVRGAQVAVDYRAQFESAAQTPSAVTTWLGAGVDPVTPDPSLGGPDGAFQLPYRSAPTQMPIRLPAGGTFDLAAAVTPNGFNDVFDALTRAGVIQKQAFEVKQVQLSDDPNVKPVNITAGLLRFLVTAFSKYPPATKFTIRVTPGAVAPVVSGLPGPGNETLDVHAPQVDVAFVDPAGRTALSVRLDARIGVLVGLGSAGAGSLTAFADGFELLDFAVMENPLGADPAEVGAKILCVDTEPTSPIACAIANVVKDGIDTLLASVALPSFSDVAPGFALAPKCLVRLDDGTAFAEFRLILPGEPIPQPSRIGAVIADPDCMGGLVLDPGGDGSSGGGGVATGGGGVFDPGPSDPGPTDPGTGGTSSGGGIGGGGGAPGPDDPPMQQL